MPAVRWTLALPDGTRIEVPSGTDLVSAAQAAGWRWPRSCRNGTCRTCRVRVIAGEAVHRIDWPGLSREELAEGWVLPCVCEARSDLVVDAEARHDTMTLKPR
ncbi:2Fe-2S iron-sulfur cluster binding domain-containing protein [Leptothrix discophora]|uniref:2Fe-2S iron-sulfur cluster binding domain-containing protein n=1 Tax=Leptothrix discophora TaxID=89 RepID=A0ABT9FYJ0_LEPDI|nr:2Fe-2S iron-sulfur cluster binding domain-containing protein [Leptothrix discophora]MDP4299087.1 2Fe-2S iron-sulfur cluster binding domain-containing protein [Leptothrix discophora]